MKTYFLLLAGILLSSTSLFAQREEFNRAIINDDREAIIRYGEQLLLSNHQSKEVYRKLAQAYKEKSSYSKSIDCLNKAYLLDSTDIKTTISLGEIYLANGDEDKALEYFNRTSDIDPSNTYALSLQLKIFLNKGNLTSAQKRATMLCQIDSSNFAHFRNLGIVNLRLGQNKDAAEAFEHAMLLNPKDILSRSKLCSYLITSAQYKKGTKVATDGLALMSDLKSQNAIVLRRNLALIQYNQKNADSCINLVKQLRADGDSIDVYTYKLAGYSYFMKGFYDDAAANLEVLYQKSPEADSLQFQLPFTIAQAYFNMYQLKEAKKYADIAIRNITPSPQLLYSGNLLKGQCSVEAKNYKEGIAAFEEAIQVSPTEPVAYTALKNCYLKMKNRQKAIESLNRYIAVIDRQKESGLEISKETMEDYRAVKKHIEEMKQ
ncbi:tetratricopeptide repeat protein [uncultured Acetobacteroides sp.]|uniref:tetratricopeptide repeat protein n=1 Tax=uncultured Acetobacteroides sp. TaxID=1760811 RepID=UPI0029F55A98|nr:tetratricopeptide repeat protein [uncultured Acetobacteroides sp.]